MDAKIAELDDWRGEMLSRVRELTKQAVPDVVEGIMFTGETYKDKVKLTFAKGASLEDPAGLFNSSLDGNTRRGIDLREADRIDEDAFKALVRSAADLNAA